MKTNHLSAWEQEEYLLDQRTPQMLRHLADCADCRAAVEQLEHGVAIFRDAAMEWSAECLAAHPRRAQFAPVRKLSTAAMRWAVASVVPLVLLLLAMLPAHFAKPVHPASPITDDALLEQVDEQVSVAVPSSMESLTHLVSTGTSSGAAASRSKHIVQTN